MWSNMGKLQGVVVVVVVVEGIGGSRWMRPKSKSLETFFVLFWAKKVFAETRKVDFCTAAAAHERNEIKLEKVGEYILKFFHPWRSSNSSSSSEQIIKNKNLGKWKRIGTKKSSATRSTLPGSLSHTFSIFLSFVLKLSQYFSLTLSLSLSHTHKKLYQSFVANLFLHLSIFL